MRLLLLLLLGPCCFSQDQPRREIWVTALNQSGELVPGVWFEGAGQPTGNTGMALIKLKTEVRPRGLVAVTPAPTSPWRLLVAGATVRIPDHPLEQIYVYVAPREPRPGQASPLPPLTFTRFAKPDLMRSFHTGQYQDLLAEPVLPVVYLGRLLQALESDDTLALVQDAKGLQRTLSPTLRKETFDRMVNNPKFVNQGVAVGAKAYLAPFLKMAEDNAEGAPLGYLIAGFMEAASHNPLVIGEAGTKDGRTLARLYDDRPQDFRLIYDGMKNYLREAL